EHVVCTPGTSAVATAPVLVGGELAQPGVRVGAGLAGKPADQDTTGAAGSRFGGRAGSDDQPVRDQRGELARRSTVAPPRTDADRVGGAGGGVVRTPLLGRQRDGAVIVHQNDSLPYRQRPLGDRRGYPLQHSSHLGVPARNPRGEIGEGAV